MRATVNWYNLFRSLYPVFKVAIVDLVEASAADSPGGRRITKEEAKQLASDLLERLADSLAAALFDLGRVKRKE